MRGDLKTARALSADALQRFARSDDDAIWSLRVLHGEILNGVASCTESMQYLDHLKLPRRLADAKPAVDRLLALATAANRCKQLDIAKRSFASAQRLAGDESLLGSVIVRKADFEIMTGSLAEADRDVKRLIPLARRIGKPRIESRGWAALAKLRGYQERYDEAIDASRQALTIANAGNDLPLSLAVRMNLGWLYVASGDYDNAVDILTAVDAEYARLGRKADRIAALLQLGNAALAQRQFDRAFTDYTQALSIAQELNHPAAEPLFANLARVELERGNAAAAERYNTEALRRGGKGDSALRYTITGARIAFALGRRDDAERAFQRVIAEAKSAAVRAEALTFAAEFHQAAGSDAKAEAEFRQAIAIAESARKDLKSDELKLSFPATRRRMIDGYVTFLVSRHRGADALAVADRSRARTLTEALGVGVSRAAKFNPQAVAREHGTVVSYWLTPARSFLWVCSPSKTTVFELPPDADIARDVDGYQRDLAGPRGSLEMSGARGAALWQMLIGPAAPLLAGAKKVVIIPDKRLYVLNFETLVAPAPQPHYWIEDVAIATASSMELLSRVRTRTPSALLLVGDPPQSDPAFPPLPWAAAEVRKVRAHFREATVLDKSRATPHAYDAAPLQRYGFVHFVAHGIGSTTRPLDSAVVLGRDADGYKLYARDILRHPLRARLVTISSCHGAGQRTYAGEGIVGLAWAFLRAGAHEVIAALWEVSDSATPDLMDAMYARIQRGDDPAVALREAKLMLLHSSGVYRRPLYWAPFVLYSGA